MYYDNDEYVRPIDWATMKRMEKLEKMTPEEKDIYYKQIAEKRAKTIKENKEKEAKKRTIRETFSELLETEVYSDKEGSITMMDKIAMATILNVAKVGDIKEVKILAQLLGEDVLDNKTENKIEIVLPDALKELSK